MSEFADNVTDWALNTTHLGRTDTESNGDDWKIHIAAFIVYKICFPVVLIVGTVGNVLNITVLWASKRLKAQSYIYLRFMAVADLLLILSWYVFFLTRHYVDMLDRDIHLARYYAHLHLPLANTFACISNMLLTALTIDR